MNKTPQIVVDALFEKRAKKLTEKAFHLTKSSEIQREIDDLDAAIIQAQGRIRRQRSDIGKKRKKSTGKKAVEQVKRILKHRGRVKRDSPLDSYDKGATFRQKVVFAIQSLNRFVHNREIGEFLYSLDSSKSIDEYVEKLSAVASRLRLEGAFVNHQVGGNIRNTFYGLPQWIDENKQIRKGYGYNDKYLTGKQKEAA